MTPGAAYGLTPPWDTDQMAINAAEILDEIKRRTGNYRPLSDAEVRCDCKRRRRLVRVFTGPEGATGELRLWVTVPALNLKNRRIPPLAVNIPRYGELAWTLITICADCRGGWAVFPGGLPQALVNKRAKRETVRLVYRAGQAAANDWQAGDGTFYVEGSQWADGPAGLARLQITAPTLGVVAE